MSFTQRVSPATRVSAAVLDIGDDARLGQSGRLLHSGAASKKKKIKKSTETDQLLLVKTHLKALDHQ